MHLDDARIENDAGIFYVRTNRKAGILPSDENDDVAAQAQVASELQAQGDEAATQQVQVTGGAGGGDTNMDRTSYETTPRERDRKIAVLEDEIVEAAKIVETVERLRTEMDELHRQGKEQRISFELQMAGGGLFSPTTRATSRS